MMENNNFTYQVWALGYDVDDKTTDFQELLYESNQRADAIMKADQLEESDLEEILEVVNDETEITKHIEIRVEQVEWDSETEEETETELVHSYMYC